MPHDSRPPKPRATTPPPLPPGYDARPKQQPTQSVEPPPVVAAPSQTSPPRKKISLAQFYKTKEPQLATLVSAPSTETESTQKSEVLNAEAPNHFDADADTEDELRLLPVEGKRAEKILAEILMTEKEEILRQKEIDEQEKSIRRSARQAMKHGALQFSTMQMFAAVIVGCLGIAFTRFFITSVVMQVISFLLLMSCVVCAAALRKTEDERLDIITRTLVLVYIATLLLGAALS